MSALSRKIANNLWHNYFQAHKRAYHHTIVLLGGLIVVGSMVSWHITSFLDGATHADWTPTWCQDNSGTLQIPESECDVLLDFYLATDGDNWLNTQQGNSKWFDGDGSAICWGGWNGVNCERDSMEGKHHVTQIQFDRQGNNLSGELPNSLFIGLSRLNTLSMSNNPNLIVDIDKIANINNPYRTNYTYLQFNGDNISGNVNNFVNLSNLQTLNIACYNTEDMDRCRAIGDTSFVPFLSQLTILRIGGNPNITFDLNDLSGSPQISEIYANNTHILGNIDVLANNTGMKDLSLSCRANTCDVSGHLSTLTNMPYLSSLGLDSLYNIEGDIGVLFDKNNLTLIDISHNLSIFGSLTASGMANLSNMQYFEIDDTSIGGELPLEMQMWSGLQSLNLEDTQLTGALLDFAVFPNLTRLDLGSNNLDYSTIWDSLVGDDYIPPQGCIPAPAAGVSCDPVFYTSPLEYLDISSANIGGQIPNMWDRFPYLRTLDLKFNKFTGSIPDSIANLTQLTELGLNFNNLDGDIPFSLQTMGFEGKNDLELQSNCLNTTIADTGFLSFLDNHSNGWTNQYNCRATVNTSLSSNSNLTPGICTPFTINYNNNGPQKARDLHIGYVFDSKLTISGANLMTGVVGKTYGTNEDNCFVNAIQYGTGPYYEAFEEALQSDPYNMPSIYRLANNRGSVVQPGAASFTGLPGSTELAFVLDNACPMLFGTSDPAICFRLFGQSMDSIDPSCGVGGSEGYIWDIGDMPAYTSGSIDIELCSPIDLTGTINIDTNIETSNTDNGSGEKFVAIVLPVSTDANSGDITGSGYNTPIITNSPTISSYGGGGLSRDICIGQDTSGSFYDGKCGTHNSATGAKPFDPRIFIPTLLQIKNYISTLDDSVDFTIEQVKSFLFAQNAKLTTMPDFVSFRPEDSLTRAEWAKFLVAFIENVLQKKLTNARLSLCSHTYQDIDNLGDLKNYIIKACMYQVMGLENDGNTPLHAFNPHDILLRKDLATVISRIIRGTANDGSSPYWAKHIQALYTSNIINNINPNIVDTRSNAAIILLRILEQYDTLFTK